MKKKTSKPKTKPQKISIYVVQRKNEKGRWEDYSIKWETVDMAERWWGWTVLDYDDRRIVKVTAEVTKSTTVAKKNGDR